MSSADLCFGDPEAAANPIHWAWEPLLLSGKICRRHYSSWGQGTVLVAALHDRCPTFSFHSSRFLSSASLHHVSTHVPHLFLSWSICTSLKIVRCGFCVSCHNTCHLCSSLQVSLQGSALVVFWVPHHHDGIENCSTQLSITLMTSASYWVHFW